MTRLLLCLAFLTCLLLFGGCGDSKSEQTAAKRGPALEGTDKGDSGTEPAGNAHISRADCAAIRGLERRLTNRPLLMASEPTPPLSRCRLSGSGVAINVYLDAAHAARQRYENRIVETAQFGTADPDQLPHPVAGVGDRAAGGNGANWVPAYGTLFAVRGNRWLTVTYSVAGEREDRLRAQAIALARRAFRLGADR